MRGLVTAPWHGICRRCASPATGEVRADVHELYQQVVTDPDAFELVGDQLDLTSMVLESGAKTTGEAVDGLISRMVRVPVAKATRDGFVEFLTKELGTDRIDLAKTYTDEFVSTLKTAAK